MKDENCSNGFRPPECLLDFRPAKDISFGVGGEKLKRSMEKHLSPLTKIQKVFVGDELQVDACNVYSQRILFKLLINIYISLDYTVIRHLRRIC